MLGCVADGVSREPLSQVGAAQACLLVRDEVRQRLSVLLAVDSAPDAEAVCQDLAETVADRLTMRAGFLKVKPVALSTTVAAAIVDARGGPNGRRFVAFAVGDAAALLLRDGAFRECFDHDVDSHMTRTLFFTLPTRVGRVATVTGLLAPGDALIVCTDGLRDPMRATDLRQRLAGWWGTACRIPSLPEFCWQMSFRVKTYDDDRTAICFWTR